MNIADHFDFRAAQQCVRQVIARHPEPVRTLADIGCGDGTRTLDLLRGLGQQPRRVLWVDPSRVALDSLRANTTDLSGEQVYSPSRMQELTSATVGQFDCVLSLHSLYGTPHELHRCNEHLLDLLSPVGILVIELSSSESLLHRLQREVWRATHGTELPTGRSGEVADSLRRHGAVFSETRVVERLRVPLSARANHYDELTDPERAFLEWFNKGKPLDSSTGDALLHAVLNSATMDEDGLGLDSDVTILACRKP
ncbi:class I SAM-dependent methyltransferase [Streptomyces sp. TG1A-8]|uniref:class I SAM-dependent methyltransferase n=1 Tax=Streptomyces sp. TG1A-8 TaxID=3051385 RepID=UPI00265BADFC|nr:class I SAM-dependent methyltransferase [Streptomyces sp. TG1A-8]MDO0925020.1 class I SAM-dependent methyltransferase [Streptomyces sp. TG1A-8]